MLVASLLIGAALASGTASPKPPAPPAVDLASLPPSATARPPDIASGPYPLTVHLLTDHAVAAPGDTVRVGVYLVQAPGWHTYGRSAGDVGRATEITWQLPDGATAAPFRFPVPQRFDTDNIISYGYDDQVLLFTEFTVPADAPPGPLAIAAHVGWLVCENNCIPGEADVSSSLAIGPVGTPGAYAPLFDHFAAQLPVVSDAVTIAITPAGNFAVDQEFKVDVAVRPAPGHTLGPLPPDGAVWPAFTPIIPGDVMLFTSAIEAAADGGFVVHLTGQALAVDPIPESSEIGGLVQVEIDGKRVAIEQTAPVPWDRIAVAAPPIVASPAAAEAASFPAMLGLAFLGGLLLNVMPCVLPVLTLKLYGLVAHGHGGPAERRTAGLAYGAGVLASFLALAGVVWGLRAVWGTQIGWGFQMQSPTYVAVLATIVFAFGLSLFGVFDVPVLGEGVAADQTARSGVAGHFFTGVFAALLGTPCSAPFLAPAVGYAFSRPDLGTVVLFFQAIGLGLALPFMIVAFVPALFAFLPQPGAWMDTFKKLMGFSLIATTVWLVDVLFGQLGPEAGAGFLWFLAAVGLGCFVFGHWGAVSESTGRQAGAALAGVAIAALGAWWSVDLTMAAPVDCGAPVQVDNLDFSESVPWQPFSEAAVAETAGHTVFIDFTAKWCLTCKVAESTVIDTAAVREAMRVGGVVPLKADWTRNDPVITAWLQRYGRAGVPFWLVIPADRSKAPIPLADAITPSSLIEALEAGR